MVAGVRDLIRQGTGREAVALGGVPFLPVTRTEVVGRILESAGANGGWLLTPNVDIVRQFATDPLALELGRRATIVVADGMPLVWACRLAGTPLPERVAGSDLIWDVLAGAAQRRLTVYLLGGNPGVAERAQRVAESRFPSIQFVGIYCPPFGFEGSEDQMQRAASAVEAADPDIVICGLPFSKQEILINYCVGREARTRWWLGLGASIGFVAGDTRRAPVWMQRMGVEWAHRMVQDPSRLIRRYLWKDLPFAVRLFAAAAWARLREMARLP